MAKVLSVLAAGHGGFDYTFVILFGTLLLYSMVRGCCAVLCIAPTLVLYFTLDVGDGAEASWLLLCSFV